ncbi:MAG TPA: hypothetical protein VG713_04000, partial [Pirellulales bacterium]|nr:hypothetical protein [Pirellulales bacterium]
MSTITKHAGQSNIESRPATTQKLRNPQQSQQDNQRMAASTSTAIARRRPIPKRRAPNPRHSQPVRVAVVRHPDNWKPKRPTDVPAFGKCCISAEFASVKAAERYAHDWNAAELDEPKGLWAVVITAGV